VHARWLRWTDEADADGQLDYYGLEALAVHGQLEGGETFARFRQRLPGDGLSVPLQVQLLEPELCPVTHTVMQNGTRIRAGIEFDAVGRRTAYWMYRARPGEWRDFDTSQLVRVPAATVAHLYEIARAGQIRGLPHLTQALVRMWELDKFDDATLVRQQIANLYTLFVTTPPGAAESGIDPLTGQPISTGDDGRGELLFEPGLIQELAPGQDIKFADPPAVGQTYEGFVRQQMISIAAAVDVPYEILTGDLSKVNDRTARIILHEFRRRIMQRQHHLVVHQFCRPTWAAWFDRAILSGALPTPPGYFEDPAPWRAVRWVPQGWPYIHPEQDVDAAVKARRAGLRSRSEIIAELGEDIEAVDAEIQGEDQRADQMGLRYDSDPRRFDAGGKPI
jgi:lambda family phage portal protein